MFLVSGFFNEFLRADLYKRSQGRVTRQVTFAAAALAVTLGLYRLSQTLDLMDVQARFGLSKAALHGR